MRGYAAVFLRCSLCARRKTRTGAVPAAAQFQEGYSGAGRFLEWFARWNARCVRVRHESWFDDQVFETLRTRGAALCIADTEKLETPRVVTTDYGYLRLRREDYAQSDVERWTKFVREQASKWVEVFVYFKHEEAGIGPKLASQMKELLA